MPAVGRLMPACGVKPRHAPLKPDKQNKNYDTRKSNQQRAPAASGIRHGAECRYGSQGKHRRPDNAAPHGAETYTHGTLHRTARRL